MRELADIPDFEAGQLNYALSHLEESYKRCLKINTQNNQPLSNDDLIELEALTARFSRATDIILKKIFRYLDELELENNKTVIDRIHSSEKRELISSAKEWFEIRDLRNFIAHEYSSMQFLETCKEVMKYTPEVLNTGKKIENYIQDIKEKYKK